MKSYLIAGLRVSKSKTLRQAILNGLAETGNISASDSNNVEMLMSKVREFISDRVQSAWQRQPRAEDLLKRLLKDVTSD